MDIIIAFFVGTFFNLFGLGALLLFSLVCSARESNFWSVAYAAMAAGIAMTLFKVPGLYLLYATPVYLVVGLLWSMWRYKRHVSKKMVAMTTMRDSERRFALQRLHPEQMLGSFVAWTLAWPISMVGSLIGDLIAGLEHAITNWFGAIYTSIFKRAEEHARKLDIEATSKDSK